MGLPDLVKLPYSEGYEIGLGVNFASGGPRNEAVTGAVSPPQIGPGSTVEYRVLRVHTTSEIEQLLEVSASASYGVAAFSGVEGRFKFIRNAKVQSSSLVMLVFASVRRAFQQIDHVKLTDPASEVADQLDVFTQRYGDMFVRGMSTGGLFAGCFRIDTGSAQMSDDISMRLAGSYGLFSGEAEAKFKAIQRDFRSEISIDMYHEGGPVDLRINSLDDPMELIRTVNLFLSSFAERPNEVAVPYSITLSPLSIAEGPVPPNAVELQHAQDILGHCAGRRSILIDQLNTFQHIVDKPLRFDFSNGAKREEISLAAQAVQSDLDLIARCASHAMNDPKTAQFPEEFATSRRLEYPKTKIPQLLPKPIPLQLPAPAQPQRLVIGMSLHGVALAGGWRDAATLNGWSVGDIRNLVITELSYRTRIPRDEPFFLQRFNDAELIGKAASYIFSQRAGFRTDPQMREMTTDDIRNMVIVENDARLHLGVTVLQSMDDQTLVKIGLEWFNP